MADGIKKPADDHQTSYTDTEKYNKPSEELFKAILTDKEKYKAKFPDETQTAYTDAKKYEKKIVEEFQPTFTDKEKYESKFAGELQTTYTDTEKYANKPAEKLQSSFTDSEKSKNEFAEEFQTTYTDTEKYVSKPTEKSQPSFTDSEKYKSKFADESQTTLANNQAYENQPGDKLQTILNDDEKNNNNSPVAMPRAILADGDKGEEKPEKIYKFIEEARSTIISGEEGKNKLITGDGNVTTTNSMAAANISLEAKNVFEKEDHICDIFHNHKNDENKSIDDKISRSDGLKNTDTKTIHDLKEEEKYKNLGQLGVIGTAAAGAYALYEKKQLRNDPANAHTKNKIEEGIAAVAAVGAGGFAVHEHNRNKEVKEKDEEAQGKRTYFHLF